MSKNFELMQNLGKEQDVLSADSAQAAVKATSVAPAAAAAETPIAEKPGAGEIGGLVQQVFLAPSTEAPRSVVFVSTDPDSGCTWVCAHAAQVLAARVAASVCVVDANFRDPGLHLQFGVDNGRGLSEALIQQDPIRSFVRQSLAPNLWFISSGTAREEAQTLLTSDRMRLRIAELRSEFDFVLIDSCAMSLGNDAINLGRYSDGVLIVLKAHSSRREIAKQVVEELQGSSAKVLGAVLNQRTYPIPDYVYKKI